MSRPRDWSPLRAGDPVGGDPAAIAELAARYAATAQAMETAAVSLRAIHDSCTVWSSDAGEAFRDRTGETAQAIERAIGRYDATASALAQYADRLVDLQLRADALLRQAQQDLIEQQAALQTRRVNAAAAVLDPVLDAQLADHERAAAGRIDRAGRALDVLAEEWAAAGDRAAADIEDVTSADGLDDSWWDDTLDVVASVTDAAGFVSTVFGVIAAVALVIPVVGEAIAVVAGGISLASGLVAMGGHALLATDGRCDWTELLWDGAGVASFGVGRAFAQASRALERGGSALAGRIGVFPTKQEWIGSFRPSDLLRDPSGGRVPLRPLSGGFDEAKVATVVSGTADFAGAGLTGRSVWQLFSKTPVEEDPDRRVPSQVPARSPR